MDGGETVRLKVYDAQVRPAGNIMHSIPRKGITERELRVLRSIHGNDCVVGLVQTGTESIDEREHYMELAYKYGTPRVEQLFSVQLDDFGDWLEARQEAITRDREVRNRQRDESLQASMAALAAPSQEQQQGEDDASEQPVAQQAKAVRRRPDLA